MYIIAEGNYFFAYMPTLEVGVRAKGQPQCNAHVAVRVKGLVQLLGHEL